MFSPSFFIPLIICLCIYFCLSTSFPSRWPSSVENFNHCCCHENTNRIIFCERWQVCEVQFCARWFDQQQIDSSNSLASKNTIFEKHFTDCEFQYYRSVNSFLQFSASIFHISFLLCFQLVNQSIMSKHTFFQMFIATINKL